MTDALLTAGLWTHVFLNSIVCFFPTKNPIFGELRVMVVVVATAGLWVGLAVSL
ncbi:MAG TPA: hypothetical protein VIG24_15615 [Acidimicrobiia bacterium]